MIVSRALILRAHEYSVIRTEIARNMWRQKVERYLYIVVSQMLDQPVNFLCELLVNLTKSSKTESPTEQHAACSPPCFRAVTKWPFSKHVCYQRSQLHSAETRSSWWLITRTLHRSITSSNLQILRDRTKYRHANFNNLTSQFSLW